MNVRPWHCAYCLWILKFWKYKQCWIMLSSNTSFMHNLIQENVLLWGLMFFLIWAFFETIIVMNFKWSLACVNNNYSDWCRSLIEGELCRFLLHSYSTPILGNVWKGRYVHVFSGTVCNEQYKICCMVHCTYSRPTVTG